jgi:hypothetical protein
MKIRITKSVKFPENPEEILVLPAAEEEEVTPEKEDELKAAITKTHEAVSELRKVLDLHGERSGLASSVTSDLFQSIMNEVVSSYNSYYYNK